MFKRLKKTFKIPRNRALIALIFFAFAVSQGFGLNCLCQHNAAILEDGKESSPKRDCCKKKLTKPSEFNNSISMLEISEKECLNCLSCAYSEAGIGEKDLQILRTVHLGLSLNSFNGSPIKNIVNLSPQKIPTTDLGNLYNFYKPLKSIKLTL